MELRPSARIYAFDQRLIEFGSGGWRLLQANGSGEGDVLAEAAQDAPLHYPAPFAARLRLPETGLTSADVERVVLGWSTTDGMWHLGLILMPGLAQARGSRWCGLARWHDPSASTHRAEATEAGRALALTLARPLSVVPPRQDAEQVVTESPAVPPPALPELPYTLEDWHVTAPDGSLLRLELRPGWARARILRAGFYGLWALAFLVLAITSYTSGIMLPEPEFLPILGLLSAVWLLFLAARTLVLMRRQPRVIEVDEAAQVVRSSAFQFAASEVESVVASQAVKVKQGVAPIEHVRYGELHLRLRSGRYQPLATQLHFDLKQPALEAERAAGSALLPLTEYSARTPLQATAVRVARLLGVPAWTDRRVE